MAQTLGCLPSTAPASAAPALARGYKTTTRRRRKEIRKDAAKYQRKLLDFAKQFDPSRTAHEQLGQTLRYLGWAVNEREMVTDTINVDFALKQWYTAFEIVDAKNYVLPSSPEASNDIGLGPGVASNVNVPGTKRLQTPQETAFKSAPPSWLSPVRGLVLDKATAERHAAIRAKGWALIVVPQPFWEFAARRPSDAHYARRDLLLSLTFPLLPFPQRPVELQTATGAAGKGKSSQQQRMEEAAATAAANLAAGKSDKAAASALATATADAATGRSRKTRKAARMAVSAAVEAEARSVANAAAAQ
jgi:hypothetical protein